MQACVVVASLGLFVFSCLSGNFASRIECTDSNGETIECSFDRNIVCNDGAQLMLGVRLLGPVRIPYSISVRTGSAMEVNIICGERPCTIPNVSIMSYHRSNVVRIAPLGWGETARALRMCVSCAAVLFGSLTIFDIRRGSSTVHNIWCYHLFFAFAFAVGMFVVMCVDAHALLGGESFCGDTVSAHT
jgi:hypothetical protein